ncbi:MAG: hypothetical protein ACTHMG_09665 [Sphingomonas sp.]
MQRATKANAAVPSRNNPPQNRRSTCLADEFDVDGVAAPAIGNSLATAIGSAANVIAWEQKMKKIAFIVAAAGLMTLAACNKSPEASAVENNADAVASNMETQADNLDAMADNTSNGAAADQLENAADNMNAAADNVRDNADAVADNMQ